MDVDADSVVGHAQVHQRAGGRHVGAEGLTISSGAPTLSTAQKYTGAKSLLVDALSEFVATPDLVAVNGRTYYIGARVYVATEPDTVVTLMGFWNAT